MRRPGRETGAAPGAARAATRTALLLGGACLASASLDAQEPDPLVSLGLNAVWQVPDDSRIRDEVTASFDAFFNIPVGKGHLWAYLEANTTPFRRGVSTILSEANTDAGTALSVRRSGRIQLSELNLRWPVFEGDLLTVGLLDATGYVDVSRISNDENLQFLGVSFVNNPTIEFPDYALGVAYEREPRGSEPRLSVVVTSSHGIADNTNVSYVQLLDVSDRGKGLFAAGAARWTRGQSRASIGAWVQTREHTTLAGDLDGGSNYGAFSVVGRDWGRHTVNLRLGAANQNVFLASRFAGVSYLSSVRNVAFGVAAARTWLSEESTDPTADDMTHLELFTRLRIGEYVRVTPSVQYLLNSGFDASGTAFRDAVWVGGLRVYLSL